MDVRAVVAVVAGQPLQIETVQREGPREGKVMVEIRAAGACHTDAFTPSGDDSEGLLPAILVHEGANVAVFGLGGIDKIIGVDIDDLITHTMPLNDINKAFDLMHRGESIRSVVLF